MPQVYDMDNYKFKYDQTNKLVTMEDFERTTISKFKDAKTDTKYYKYFACIFRPKCKGRIKKLLNEDKFFICKRCDMNVNHSIMTYEEFKKLLEEKNYNLINFANENYQKYFTKYLILEKNIFKSENIIIEFRKISNSNFKLSNKKISIIKF